MLGRRSSLRCGHIASRRIGAQILGRWSIPCCGHIAGRRIGAQILGHCSSRCCGHIAGRSGRLRSSGHGGSGHVQCVKGSHGYGGHMGIRNECFLHQEKLFFPWVSPKYTQRLQECQRAGKLERNPEQGHRGTVFLEVSGVVPRLLPGELKLTLGIFLCPCNWCTLLVELYIFLKYFIYPTSSITIITLKSSYYISIWQRIAQINYKPTASLCK